MKSIYIFLFFAFALAFSSCQKCETCTPYKIVNGTVLTTADRDAQIIKLCDKTDIDAYENLVDFKDGSNSPAKFICK